MLMPNQLGRSSWSWQLPDDGSAPARAMQDDPPKEASFRRAWCTRSLERPSPGSVLIAGRRRIIGSIILGLFAASVLALGIYGTVDRQNLLGYALDPKTLRRAALALVIIALVWVAIIIASHLSLRGRPTRGQRVVGGVLVGLLSFAVAAPMAVAARYSYVTASSVGAVFKTDDETKSATKPTLGNTQTTPGQPKAQDPWAGKTAAEHSAAGWRRRPRPCRHPY
jgi:hypothetical protein